MTGPQKLSAAAQARLLTKIRKICLALPETSERLSHGEPAFFYREKKSFLNMDSYHHGSTHYSAWCAAPLGAQDLWASCSTRFPTGSK